MAHQLTLGDQKALAEIYDRFSDALYGVCIHILKRPEQAQDALQKAFIKIWQKAKSYDPDKAGFYTWMLRITRNTAIDIYRSEMRHKNIQNESFSVHILDSSDTIELNEDTIDLKDHLSALDGDHADILRLAYIGGFTQKQISEQLDIPLGTVKTRVRNGLKKLRNIYKEK